MARFASLTLWTALVLAGCAPLLNNARLLDVPAPASDVTAYPTTPLRWHYGPRCADQAPSGARNRQDLAAACPPSPHGHDFVAIAISGGGAKASTFGGEALFMLQALGLLQHADVVSSVSGGSFAAALYALSCDSGDQDCLTERGRGVRPTWHYADTMKRLSQGYIALIAEFGGRAIVPVLRTAISNDRFAGFIDRNYLADARGRGAGFTFADLNPRRPHLFVNSAIVSGHRFVIDDVADCRPVSQRTGRASAVGNAPRGFLRRRSGDEFSHFSFTDYYFRRLCSDIGSYPLARAVAASGAFPALIDYATLEDHARGRGRALLLTDGGANDNQGLTEVYLHLTELLVGQRRSEPRHGEQLGQNVEAFGPRDRGLIFVINTSLTEATGVEGRPVSVPSLAGFLVGTAGRASSAFDRASAATYSTRSRLYLRELALAQAHLRRTPAWRDRPSGDPIRIHEVGLTVLDEYPFGGPEAHLRQVNGVWDEPAFDPDRERLERQRTDQRAAFEALQEPGARERLGLSDVHPQCLFERSKDTDASIFSLAFLPRDVSVCLRHAARWSVALRAQELCNGLSNGKPPLNDTSYFQRACVSHRLSLLGAHADDRLTESCDLGRFDNDDGLGPFLTDLRDRRIPGTPVTDLHLLPDTQCRVRPPRAASR